MIRDSGVFLALRPFLDFLSPCTPPLDSLVNPYRRAKIRFAFSISNVHCTVLVRTLFIVKVGVFVPNDVSQMNHSAMNAMVSPSHAVSVRTLESS